MARFRNILLFLSLGITLGHVIPTKASFGLMGKMLHDRAYRLGTFAAQYPEVALLGVACAYLVGDGLHCARQARNKLSVKCAINQEFGELRPQLQSTYETLTRYSKRFGMKEPSDSALEKALQKEQAHTNYRMQTQTTLGSKEAAALQEEDPELIKAYYDYANDAFFHLEKINASSRNNRADLQKFAQGYTTQIKPRCETFMKRWEQYKKEWKDPVPVATWKQLRDYLLS